MKANKAVNKTDYFVFRHRGFIIGLFVLLTLFLLNQASHIRLDAAFTKNIPLQHPYMQTYLKHEKQFGGANSILISVCDSSGNIFNKNYFDTLKAVHDQLYFIPGVDRTLVKSIFSPSTRFVEVVEDGFAGGPVIPAEFQGSTADLDTVKGNIDKAGIVGRMVADDYSCAMVTAQLMEVNPETQEKIDTIAFAKTLEQDVRGKFASDSISIHIIGFAKMVGDVADGARGVLLFFVIAIAITSLMVLYFCRSWRLTLLTISCSLVAVVWQIGLLNVIGFGIDPMSILVPFLVFAIGVSHGVQMINAIKKRVEQGNTTKVAAELSFRSLLVPGGIALLSDTVGFITLLAIDIGIIRELAITASLGVAVIIFTNLLLLPVLASFLNLTSKQPASTEPSAFWQSCVACCKSGPATFILIVTAALFAFGYWYSQGMKIGDLQAGAPSLHQDSRYNQDTFLITDRYAISVDILKVIVETVPEACTRHELMDNIDQFQWWMENIAGVQSAISLATVAKQVNAGFNEGNLKWRVLPRNTASLVQASSRVETSTGLLNGDCSVIPVLLFLADHKAETIERVIAAVKQYGAEFGNAELNFALASGPVGVMAATNEAVAESQAPMMWYVYGAVILLCLLSFRSLRATIAIVVPLYIVSTLAQALMTKLNIGLTVSTLPVIALGVGIGVDYGIYILSSMNDYLRQGMPVVRAYYLALLERGSAVLFTGITLAIGVSTWVFSALKFQVDMGILLTFMFVVNMLGAVLLLPAIAALLWSRNQKNISA